MTEPTPPTVAVVVPVRDDPAGLAACLAALGQQTYPRDRVEVVVADSASTPAVGPVTGARVVRVDAPGSYRARTAALATVTADVVAFTDADCRPRPDWLTRAVEHLVAGADVVAGAVHVFPRDPARRTTVELFEAMFAFPQEHYVRERGFGATANLVTWRRVLEDTGPFDPTLASGGDVEWGQRATGHGARLVHAPDAVVDHPARRSWRQLVAKRRRTMEGTVHLDVSGRLDWSPGLRMYLVPDRATYARVRHDGRFTRWERLRIMLAVLVEDLAAAWTLARTRRRLGRREAPRD